MLAELTYKRAGEDKEWAKLCHKHDVVEDIFNAGLDYTENSPKKLN